MSLDSNPLFGRAYVIELGDLKFEHLTIGGPPALDFEATVVRDDSPIPNTVSLQIFNLNEETRGRLEQEPELTCRIQAGYQKDFGQVFFGVVRNLVSYKDGSTWVTECGAGDGEQATSQSPKMYQVYAKGTTYADIIKDVAGRLGLEVGDLSSIEPKSSIGGGALERTTTIQGEVSLILTRLCKSMKHLWYINEGKIEVFHEDSGIADSGQVIIPTQRVKTDPKTGIISLESLLIHDLLPGYTATVDSPQFSGGILVKSTKHTMASRGAWSVAIEGKPL